MLLLATQHAGSLLPFISSYISLEFLFSFLRDGDNFLCCPEAEDNPSYPPASARINWPSDTSNSHGFIICQCCAQAYHMLSAIFEARAHCLIYFTVLQLHYSFHNFWRKILPSVSPGARATGCAPACLANSLICVAERWSCHVAQAGLPGPRVITLL